jgi:nicotinamidase-related amidase
VSTAYTVEGTVRQATDIGYRVTVAADACSTATQAQHEAALTAMRAIAEIKTVDEILAAV